MTIEVTKLDNNITRVLFSVDEGKHGTNEIIDFFDLNNDDILEALRDYWFEKVKKSGEERVKVLKLLKLKYTGKIMKQYRVKESEHGTKFQIQVKEWESWYYCNKQGGAALFDNGRPIQELLEFDSLGSAMGHIEYLTKEHKCTYHYPAQGID